ncbi:MAG: hypothetical protein PHC64_02290 [Candidatus Gastranaerophilales bacterium]|nr:hypothetical protein [Candidatus Gastranaerophilales bacterium]
MNENHKNTSIIKQLMRDKFALIALIVLFIIYFSLLFADFIAPYSKDFSDRKMAYAPPSKIFTINEHGKLSLPYTYNYKREFDPEAMQVDYKLDRSQKYFLKFFVRGEKYKFLGIIPCSRHFIGVTLGGHLYLLGTDINGRDVFSRLLFGGRISMTIGFLALFVLFPIGLLYGGISGYFGGKVDMLMMRFAEAVMSIPSLSFNNFSCDFAFKYDKYPKVYIDCGYFGFNRLGGFCSCCSGNGFID